MLSDEIVLNTGAPHGCILCEFLQFIFQLTQMTYPLSGNNSILTQVKIKYADNMALVGNLKDEFSLSEYHLLIDYLTYYLTYYLTFFFLSEHN